MALREINIPFGPDKTGGMGFGALAEDSDPDGVNDPFAPPSPDKYRNDTPAYGQPSGEWNSWQGIPAGSSASVPDYSQNGATQPVAFSDIVTLDDFDIELDDVEDAASAPTGSTGEVHYRDDIEDDAELDDVQQSFVAWKSALGQSRELKAREREMEDLRAQIEARTQELQDREYILENYEKLIAEQNHIIDECTRQRDSDKDELAQVVTQIEQMSAELEELQNYHSTQMQPLQTEIGRANAAADQAKNDERSRKSELNAAESEVRHASTAGDTAVAQAKYDHVKQAYDQACTISNNEQDHLNELKRIYDDAVHQIEQTEGPIKRAIEDLQHDEEQLKEIIAQLGEDISVARKRLQYCEGVKQFPEETDKLKTNLALDESDLLDLETYYDELKEELQLSKSKARKAKIALGIGVVIVIVVVAVLLSIFMH